MTKRMIVLIATSMLALVTLFPAIVLFRKHLVFAGQNAGWPMVAGELVALFAFAYAIELAKKRRALSTALLWLAASALLGGVAFVQMPHIRQLAAAENREKLEADGRRQIAECGQIFPSLQAKIDAANLRQQAIVRELSDPTNAVTARFESRASFAGALACAVVAVIHAVQAVRGERRL